MSRQSKKLFPLLLASLIIIAVAYPILTQSYATDHKTAIEKPLTPNFQAISNIKENSSMLIVYSSSGCGTCRKQVELLQLLCGNSSVTFHDIYEDKNREYYTRIRAFLVDNGVISALDTTQSLIPLSGYFKNGNLETVIFGPYSEKDWKTILDPQNDGQVTHCILGSPTSSVEIKEQTVTESLATFFKQTAPLTSASGKDNMLQLIPLVSLAAAIDAINPCELNAFLILLVYVFYHVGKKDVLKIGLAFSSAVFISYYILGLGALRVLQSVPLLWLVIAALGLAIGALEVLAFLGLKRKHVPNSFATRIRERVVNVTNPYTAFLAGVLVSLFLLPCTSGSYFVALDLLAKNASFAAGLLLLTLYNGIVVLPFIAIALIIYTLTFKTAKLRIWLNDKEKWLRLFGGTTMIIISLLLFLTH